MKLGVSTAVAVAVLLAIACGDGGGGRRTIEEAPSNESIEISEGGPVLIGGFDAGTSGQTAAATLPGITVIGTAEATAEPDGALIRLTIGAGSEFGPPPGRLQFIDEEEMEPVVKALKDAGGEDVVVNTLAASPFGPYGAGAAQITLTWPRPREVNAVLEAAEDAVRENTEYNLQNVETLFTLKECEDVEEGAWEAALGDAGQRAQRLARLAGATLGDAIAISEAATISPYGPSLGLSGCQALRSLPAFAGYSPPVASSPSQVTISVSLQVTFAIK